jgi:hypothetical protein
MTVTTLIDGVMGHTDLACLEKKDGVVDTDTEYTTWVEYRLKGQPDSAPVHRSVHVTLKRGMALEPVLGRF